eukprot:583318-Pleurochrysis_carterae.AAC.1
MAAVTRNHATEFLPGGICAAEQITFERRERLSGMPCRAGALSASSLLAARTTSVPGRAAPTHVRASSS